jgi:hypothetical protein
MAIELNPLRLGVAGGIIWGLWLLILGLGATYANYATAAVTTLSSIYIGYGPTLTGSIMGFIDGFICAFVGLLLLGWVYNYLAPYIK